MKDRIDVERIKTYGVKITTYMRGVQNVQEFLTDEQKVDAVMLNLEQIW